MQLQLNNRKPPDTIAMAYFRAVGLLCGVEKDNIAKPLL